MLKRLSFLAITAAALAYIMHDDDSAVNHMAQSLQNGHQKRAYAYTVALHGINDTLSVKHHVGFLSNLKQNQCAKAKSILAQSLKKYGEKTINADYNNQISKAVSGQC